MAGPRKKAFGFAVKRLDEKTGAPAEVMKLQALLANYAHLSRRCGVIGAKARGEGGPCEDLSFSGFFVLCFAGPTGLLAQPFFFRKDIPVGETPTVWILAV